MPNPQGAGIPIVPHSQASPYVIAKAFPEATIPGAGAGFRRRLRGRGSGGDGHHSWAFRQEAEEAYRAAVGAQLEAEAAMRCWRASPGRCAGGWPAGPAAGGPQLQRLSAGGLAVHRPEAGQHGRAGDPRRLSAAGGVGPTAWHYPNLIMNAVALAKRHANLFLLYVSNFSCTIDAFTHSFFAVGVGAKPYLMLEINAHTADAGIQTRLEAFWDIIRNYRD